jgi:hypothetical protein
LSQPLLYPNNMMRAPAGWRHAHSCPLPFLVLLVQMAGLPAAVVHRAAAVATELQQQNEQASGVLSQHGVVTSQDGLERQAVAAGEQDVPGESAAAAAAAQASDSHQQPHVGSQDKQQLLEVVQCLQQLQKEPQDTAAGGSAAAGSRRLQELWAQVRELRG